MWGNGVMFTALLGAAKDDPKTYRPATRRVLQIDGSILGRQGARSPATSQPHPRRRQRQVLRRQRLDGHHVRRGVRADAATAVTSSGPRRRSPSSSRGWDDAARRRHLVARATQGRHEEHLRQRARRRRLPAPRDASTARQGQGQFRVAIARRIVDWTTRDAPDRRTACSRQHPRGTGKLNHGKLTYNTALMIRAYPRPPPRHRRRGFLRQAQRSAKAVRLVPRQVRARLSRSAEVVAPAGRGRPGDVPRNRATSLAAAGDE